MRNLLDFASVMIHTIYRLGYTYDMLFVELNVALFPSSGIDMLGICFQYPAAFVYINQPAIWVAFKCFGSLRWLRCLLSSVFETECPLLSP